MMGANVAELATPTRTPCVSTNCQRLADWLASA
jgi:hypothetical protein